MQGLNEDIVVCSQCVRVFMYSGKWVVVEESVPVTSSGLTLLVWIEASYMSKL